VSQLVAPAVDRILVPIPHRVLAVFDELDDVRTLHVAPVDGDPAPFEPAQCGMVGLPGLGEAPLSISSDPDDHDHHAYTIRSVGPITAGLVALTPGDQLIVRGPFGNVWPISNAEGGDVLVVAGGIGLAPLRSLVLRLATHRDRYGRVALVIGARAADRLLYGGEYDEWRARGIDVHVTVDIASASWRGAVGLVTTLVEPLALRWPMTTAFVCGPDEMMHHLAAQLLALGVDPTRIQLTLERNMQCGNGLCGHCQLGPMIVCRDGPVVSYATIGHAHRIKEL
jgi:anaerobic sulfite reductase subunit B